MHLHRAHTGRNRLAIMQRPRNITHKRIDRRRGLLLRRVAVAHPRTAVVAVAPKVMIRITANSHSFDTA